MFKTDKLAKFNCTTFQYSLVKDKTGKKLSEEEEKVLKIGDD